MVNVIGCICFLLLTFSPLIHYLKFLSCGGTETSLVVSADRWKYNILNFFDYVN